MKYTQSDLQKIRWRCARRGMMEMDIILTEFFDREFLNLTEHEQETFLRLINEVDPVLWDWFFTEKKPEDLELQWMIEKIRLV